jgi:VanZ family protein
MKPKRAKQLFIVYTVILVLLAVLPINSSGNSINHTYVVSIRLDYVLHFAIFIPWMVLLWRLTGNGFRKDTGKAVLWILLALLFAMANEAVQYFLPYRAFNINDLIANGVGVLLGAVVFGFPSLQYHFNKN